MCGLPLAKPECIVDVADRYLGSLCWLVLRVGCFATGTARLSVMPRK
jgi:hypothetical protein